MKKINLLLVTVAAICLATQMLKTALMSYVVNVPEVALMRHL
jgi:hypothetical protein